MAVPPLSPRASVVYVAIIAIVTILVSDLPMHIF